MMNKLLRFANRQLHTIVSRDIIKPSLPTPSHLKTYTLSLLDRITLSAYMPVVAFYPSSSVYQSSVDKTLELKNSLSQTLTQYYPFAGKMKKTCPTYVDCNDEGVDFIEACNDNSLSDFLRHSENKDLDQLFPNDLIWFHPRRKCGDDDGRSDTCPVAVQVNHFSCGGIAVAISLSHKIGDGSSILSFMNHWAKENAGSRLRDQSGASPVNPHFITYQTRDINLQKEFHDGHGSDFIAKSFLFPNKKLNELKAKVIDMTSEFGEPIMNPTRVEVLTWLLHKCAVAAATKAKSVGFKDTGMVYGMNIRNTLIPKLPETSIGNLYMVIEFPTSNQSNEITPNMTIGQLRKRKAALQSITSLDTVLEILAETFTDDAAMLEMSGRMAQYYSFSSLCGYPTYSIDFGWGKPVKLTLSAIGKNSTILMDTPNGIEALVSLDRHEMMIFENDTDLLNFC